MEKNWRIHPHEPERISHLERTAGIPPIVAQLLLCRGVYDPSAAKAFLDCKLSGLRDPGELPGANEAASRVYAAVKDKRKIAVYGDYDADGMTAASVCACSAPVASTATWAGSGCATTRARPART